jgi:hypothetical protein
MHYSDFLKGLVLKPETQNLNSHDCPLTQLLEYVLLEYCVYYFGPVSYQVLWQQRNVRHAAAFKRGNFKKWTIWGNMGNLPDL